MTSKKPELADYCGALFSVCERTGFDCSKCSGVNKEEALRRKREGKTVRDEIKRPGS